MVVKQAPPLRSRDTAVSIPTSAFTLTGFREWVKSEEFPEGIKATYLGHEVFIEMSPEFFDTHNTIKTELYIALGSLLKELDLGRLVSDRMLYINEAAEVSTEPDAAFFTWEAWNSGRIRLDPSSSGRPNFELVGSLDWVAEVVSETTERKDLRELRTKYFAAGVPEYWTIDARGDDLNFEILVCGDDDYRAVPGTADGWMASPVFQREFRLTREQDRIGLWMYTLEVRPLTA